MVGSIGIRPQCFSNEDGTRRQVPTSARAKSRSQEKEKQADGGASQGQFLLLHGLGFKRIYPRKKRTLIWRVSG
jgi:hypothetical protein